MKTINITNIISMIIIINITRIININLYFLILLIINGIIIKKTNF